MSTLREHLGRLQTWLRGLGGAPPWEAMRIAESAQITYGEIDVIPRSALWSVEAYEPRFESLTTAGYAWINLNGAGVIEGALLVIVELPRAPTRTSGRPSVNLSGPRLNVATKVPLWDASAHIRLA